MQLGLATITDIVVGHNQAIGGAGGTGANGGTGWGGGLAVATRFLSGNPADGTYYTSPDSAETSAVTFTNSGVINYINKFGTTGSGALRYKGYDDVGRLYYEAVNYLRNRGPTTNPQTFYAGITTSNSDGFPAILSRATGGAPDRAPGSGR